MVDSRDFYGMVDVRHGIRQGGDRGLRMRPVVVYVHLSGVIVQRLAGEVWFGGADAVDDLQVLVSLLLVEEAAAEVDSHHAAVARERPQHVVRHIPREAAQSAAGGM